MKSRLAGFVVLWATSIVFIGCDSKIKLTKNLQPDAETIGVRTLDVDGRKFTAFGQQVVLKNNDKRYFVLIVCPQSQKGQYRTAVGYDTKIGSGQHRFLGKLVFQNEKEVSAEANTVYFVDDNRVLFSRKMEELETNNTNVFEFLEKTNLQPILEKMIRDNLPKDEDVGVSGDAVPGSLDVYSLDEYSLTNTID